MKNLNLTHSCISHLLQTSIIIFTCRQNTTPTAENTNYRHTRNTPHIRIMSRTIIKVIILYKFFKAPTQRLGFFIIWARLSFLLWKWGKDTAGSSFAFIRLSYLMRNWRESALRRSFLAAFEETVWLNLLDYHNRNNYLGV